MDLHLVSDDQSTGIEGFIPHHAEIFAIQFTVGGESGSRISPGVFRDAVQRASEGTSLVTPWSVRRPTTL